MKIYYLPKNVIEKIKSLIKPGDLMVEFNGVKADLYINGVPLREENADNTTGKTS